MDGKDFVDFEWLVNSMHKLVLTACEKEMSPSTVITSIQQTLGSYLVCLKMNKEQTNDLLKTLVSNLKERLSEVSNND